MSRYSGRVGFAETVETSPGVWSETIKERHYFGDVNRAVRRLENGTSINDDVVINNEISIVADPYGQKHFFNIRYAEWQDVKWKVSNVEVLYPRLILTLGGIWNGNT